MEFWIIIAGALLCGTGAFWKKNKEDKNEGERG